MAQKKAKAYQEKKEEEDRAKSKANEIRTQRWKSDILNKELALPFLKEAYFSDKKAVQEAMEKVKGIAPKQPMLILEERRKDKTMSGSPEPSHVWLVMMEQPC